LKVSLALTALEKIEHSTEKENSQEQENHAGG
jgi:hypothetical protein